MQVGNTVDCEQLRDLMCKRSAAELLSNLNMANKSVALSADEAQHWRHFLCNVAKVGEILSKHHASTLLRSTPILSRATDVHLSEETLKRLMEDAVATLSVIIDIAWRCVQREIDIQAVMTLPMDFIVAVFRQENAQDMMTRARTARDVADQFAGANREAARVVVKNQIVRSVLLPWAERVIVEVG